MSYRMGNMDKCEVKNGTDMRKIISLGIITMIIHLSVHAQFVESGYRGFVEGGYSINTGATIDVNFLELNTIHGYQTLPQLFFGVGIGFHSASDIKKNYIDGIPHWKREGKLETPIFADIKWTIQNRRITPYVDLRLGHYASNGSGIYGSIGAGCRFALNNKSAIYGQLAYTIQKLEFEESYMVIKSYSYYWNYKTKEDNFNSISVRIGYDF